MRLTEPGDDLVADLDEGLASHGADRREAAVDEIALDGIISVKGHGLALGQISEELDAGRRRPIGRHEHRVGRRQLWHLLPAPAEQRLGGGLGHPLLSGGGEPRGDLAEGAAQPQGEAGVTAGPAHDGVEQGLWIEAEAAEARFKLPSVHHREVAEGEV